MQREAGPITNRWTDAPLRVATEALINTDPEPLFRALSDPDQMCRLFPWMQHVSVESIKGSVRNRPLAGNGADPAGHQMIRRCHFGNGMVLEEAIVSWHPPHQLAYRGIDETHPFGMIGHVGIVLFTPDQIATRLNWQQFFHHSNPDAMCAQIGANMEMALETLIELYGGGIVMNEIVG